MASLFADEMVPIAVTEALRVWLLIEAIGLAGAGLARVVLGRLPGGGLGFGKVLGLLLLRGGAPARLGWSGVIAFHVLLMAFGFGIWVWSLPALAFLVPAARADWPALAAPTSVAPAPVVSPRVASTPSTFSGFWHLIFCRKSRTSSDEAPARFGWVETGSA